MKNVTLEENYEGNEMMARNMKPATPPHSQFYSVSVPSHIYAIAMVLNFIEGWLEGSRQEMIISFTVF